MNERIEELAKQAGLESFYVEYSPWQVEFEKFAELIVRENIRLISVRKNEAIDNGWNVDETCSAIEIDLVEHFGIE